MVARVEKAEARRRPSDDDLLRRAHRAQPRPGSTGAPLPAVGALGRQPAQSAGARARRSTARSGSPAGCRTCPTGWSTTCSSTSWPTCSRPATTTAFWALGRPLPAGRAGEGLARRLLRGCPARGRPATDADGKPLAGERDQLVHLRLEVGQASSGHQRTSSDSSLTACVGTGRRQRGVPDVEVVGACRARRRTPPRARRGGPAPGRRAGRRARTPRSPRAARRRRASASPGSQWPPNWNHRGPCACRLSSTASSPADEHERAGGEVVRRARRASARRGASSQVGDEPVAQRRLGRRRRASRPRSAASAVGVGAHSSGGPSAGSRPRRPCRRRAGCAARRRSRPR